MTNSESDPEPPEGIPSDAKSWLDSLDPERLRDLLSYLEQRLDSLRTPIEEMIQERAAGEVRSIDSQGAYAHVTMHPPTADGEEVERDILSIYHVSREEHADGEETLHWAYLGDVQSTESTRCSDCGRTYGAETDTCPHCGGTGFTTQEDGGDDDE